MSHPTQLRMTHRNERAWRRRLQLAVCAALVAFGVSPSNAFAAPPPEARAYKADFSFSMGPLMRSAVDGADNSTGASYDTSFGHTFRGHMHLWPWLRFGGWVQRGYHSISIANSAIDPTATNADVSKLLAYTIGARVMPTYQPIPRLHTFASVGIGWGRLTTPKIKVQTPTRSYEIDEREGVLLEVPFGLGAAFEIIPGWIAINLDLTWAPTYSQTGSLFSQESYVDSQGHIGQAPPFPKLRWTASQMLGVMMLF